MKAFSICGFCIGSILTLLSVQAFGQQLAIEAETVKGQPLAVQASENAATVVCFLGTECPMARGYVGKLNALHEQYAKSNVQVVGVMSNRQDSREDILKYIEDLGAEFPVVHDEGNAIADRFGASRTPEVFLLDSELKLRYRGRIDDQLAPGVARAEATRQDLKIATDELLAGKPVSIRETRALGCIIGRMTKSASDSTTVDPDAVTFTNEVIRVLRSHCTECHRDGQIGPFAMNSYEEVVGWAETMLETVEDGRMPPWHADPTFGNFQNERSMPEADKQILRDWIAGGLPKGNEANMPEPQKFVQGWSLPREPDLVVEMRSRPFTVPKDGVVEYQYFVADPGLTEDVWVTAAEVVPGERAVVHHAIVFVRPPDGAEFNGIGWLTAYVPGQRIQELPPGRARKVVAGSKFVFQMHYTPNGVEENDVTRVGVLFAKEDEVTHNVFTTVAIDQEFEIPPGDANYRVSAEAQRLPRDGELLAITPHMHVRGKSFKLMAIAANERSADGVSSPSEDNCLLYVPQYDFNWQHTYLLSRPLPLSSVDGLHFEATFDNSAKNPFNPDPSNTVTWGDQTFEEMAIAFFEVAEPVRPIQEVLVASDEARKTQQSRAAHEEKIEGYVKLVMDELDANGDGVIKKSEAAIVVRYRSFDLWDANGDDVATEQEVRRAAEGLIR